MTMPTGKADSPFLFFDCVVHYGGSNKSTLSLIREMQKLHPVVVLDAYGICREYLEDLSRQETPCYIISPEARHATIGGKTRTRRLLNISRSMPETLRTIRMLRKIIFNVAPRAIWINSQKAMFLLSRAIGNSHPTVIYVRGELKSINPWLKYDWRRLKLIVGNSRKGLNFLDRVSGLPERRVIYNGVDIQEIWDRSEQLIPDLPAMDSQLKMVMPATLIPLKNHAMAIRGLAEYIHSGGQAVLWICGDIPKGVGDSRAIEALHLPEKLGISQYVHFLGWQKNVPAILRRADVITLTSRTEGMPRSVMEAMALGKPVLVTDVGGIPELVRDGIDGIVVASEDVSAFAAGLARLSDSKRRLSMGQSGQLRIADKFCLKNQAKIFSEALDSIS